MKSISKPKIDAIKSIFAIPVIVFLLYALEVWVWCPFYAWISYSQCFSEPNLTSPIAFIGIALLSAVTPFLLITLPFPVAVFESWKKFAIWAVPIMVVLTSLIVLGGEGGSYINFGVGPFLLMILYGLYCFVSLIVIILAALKTRKKA
jgi:hypothetical protein